MPEENLIAFLNQQINNLCQIQSKLYSQRNNFKSSAIRTKIQLQVHLLQSHCINLKNKSMSQQKLSLFWSYFKNRYDLLVKQSEKILTLSSTALGNKYQDAFDLITNMENELENKWQEVNSQQLLSNQIMNITDQKNLKKMINEQLCKEFLLIKIMAYQLYEKYNEHNHQPQNEELITLQQQKIKIQQELEIIQLESQKLKQLKEQIQIQLKGIQRINQLVSQRYFKSRMVEQK